MGFSRQEYWSGMPLPSLTRAAGRGKSEKRDMEEEEAKGDLGSVIHSYTICTRFLEIK